MTSPSSFDVPDPQRAPSTPDVVPTWRDLPREPPYGPVLPPQTPNVGLGFAPVVVEDSTPITPSQIALAVVGLVVLAVIGIGAALLVLGDDDPAVADDPPVETESDVAEQGTVDPVPPAAPQPVPDAAPAPPSDAAPDPPQGELLPEDPSGGQTAPPGNGEDQAPADPGAQPDPLPTQPGTGDAPAGEDGDVDLPLLFRLRTLPSGTAEDATTVRQTTEDDEVVTEQVTTLTADPGEVEVRATRGADVAATLAEVQAAAGVEEVSILGLPGYLVGDGQRLVFLLPGEVETLIEVDGPEGLGTEALLTIGQGLELLR